MAIPSLIVFDLDACLWSPEMEYLDNAPSTYDANLKGVKAGRDTVKLYPGAQSTLMRLLTEPCFKNCKVAAASSTIVPAYAQTCLEQMPIDPTSQRNEVLADLITLKQIYPGSKGRNHFPRIQNETGIRYTEMIFFDDCTYSDNCKEVATMCAGVTCVRTPRGLTAEQFNIALAAYSKDQKGLIR